MHVFFISITSYPMTTFFCPGFPASKSRLWWNCYSAFSAFLTSIHPTKSCDVLGHCQTIKDVSASYDALLDLFESFESFLARLDIYTKIPSTTAMTEIVVKILIELLSTISLAIQHVKQGRLSKPDSAHKRLINVVRSREIWKEALRRE